MALADTRYQNRRRALAAQLAAQRVDELLVTHLVHVRYLSGFTGDNAALSISKELVFSIATDSRFTTQVAQEVPDLPAVIQRNCAVALLSQVTKPRRVGFEADYLSVSELESLREAAGEDVQLVPIRGIIEELRLVKDTQELQALRDVAQLGNQALRELIDAHELAVGRREIEVAADLEYRMRKLGSEKPSFDTIVASGANAAMPHHTADNTIIREGDLVTIDFGAQMNGYNSDMTRTFVMGVADSFSQDIYSVVLEAQRQGIAAARAGMTGSEVDRAARDVIAQAGFGDQYIHSTGHGVGMEVHEGPAASSSSEDELRPGMTLTVEPGIYVPGRGGVRIEDTLFITAAEPELITQYGRDLMVIERG